MIYLCYEYKNKLIKTRSKDFIDENNFDINKISFAIRSSLMKKFKITLEQYVSELGFDVYRCGFCGEYAKINIEIRFENYKKRKKIIVTKISYPYDYYCKGRNPKCEGRKYNPNSTIFVSRTKNINEDEALRLIHSRNKSPFYLENYDSYNDYKNYQSLENRLDGEKYSSFINNLKMSKTIEYYINKFGNKEGKLIWDNICKKKDSMSLDFFLRKNNYDYEKSIIEYKNRLKSSVPNFRMGGTFSPVSITFFNNLLDRIKINKYLYGKNEFIIEYYTEDNKKKKFYYDFVDLDNKIIIEYNGLVWHPNKEKMTTEQWDKWYFPYDKTISAEDIINKDRLKEKVAIDNGYTFISVWDCDGEEFNIDKIINIYKKINIIK